MTIQIRSIHFDADAKLIDYINKKVEKLPHFFDAIIASEVFLKIEKSSTDDNKVVEIKLNIPGNDLFVKRQCATFEAATDECLDALKQQIKKHKGKSRKSLIKDKSTIDTK
jgi:putative sigma-54 modulation protein